MFLFILCSLTTYLCPLPSPAAPPVTAAVIEPAPPITEGDTGPLWGIGQPWTGVTEKDTGYCEGYDMPTGEGARPSLSWPVPGGVLHEGRGFRVGHTGYDIDAAEGSPVLAAAGGTVVWSGWCTWGFRPDGGSQSRRGMVDAVRAFVGRAGGVRGLGWEWLPYWVGWDDGGRDVLSLPF